MNEQFKLITDKTPKGDQPTAIKSLVDGYGKHPLQVLLGITGSGKTFTMANVIEQVNKPTLVLAHNKTLAHQLYTELKELFPENKVTYFVSYFDYYQPESYMPATDTYIEKDSKVNKQISQLRLNATAGLLSRNDVIVVSSISCIYGIGSPGDWQAMAIKFTFQGLFIYLTITAYLSAFLVTILGRKKAGEALYLAGFIAAAFAFGRTGAMLPFQLSPRPLSAPQLRRRHKKCMTTPRPPT